MSTVFLHVGQCGNQVGIPFWKRAAKDENVKNGRTFLHEDGTQRSLHIDSEPKVIAKINKTNTVRKKNLVFGRRGRGTNWALGYNGLLKKGEDHIVEDTMEMLRKEIEGCDSYSGCILMHSLSGGTGSGLGSRLCEMVRDEYPMSHVVSCSFAPCQSGESPLQHYNSLLTLAYLNRYTDCNILTHNDLILERLQKKMETVSFNQMNENIAAALCGVTLPTDTLTTKCGASIGMEPWEMVRSLCPHPGNKIVQINHIARSKLSWEAMMSQLLLNLHRYDKDGKPYRSLSTLIVARGDSTDSFHSAMKTLEKKVKNAYSCVPWNPYPLDIWTARNNLSGSKSASLSVASNHSSVVDYLDFLLSRSQTMYKAGAYLHWYWRYGATEDDFNGAFEEIASVVDSYKEAIK